MSDDLPPIYEDLGVAEPASEQPPTASVGELQELLDELLVAVEEAKAVPLSSNVMVDREQMLAMLRNLRDRLPEELRAARWMIREREAFVGRTNERARSLMERARTRADELVSESHIMAEAVEEANILVRRAEGEARRVRLESEDYADDRYQRLEELYGKLLGQVRDAREALRASRPAEPPVPGV
jgi:hypothetical protein